MPLVESINFEQVTVGLEDKYLQRKRIKTNPVYNSKLDETLNNFKKEQSFLNQGCFWRYFKVSYWLSFSLKVFLIAFAIVIAALHYIGFIFYEMIYCNFG